MNYDVDNDIAVHHKNIIMTWMCPGYMKSGGYIKGF